MVCFPEQLGCLSIFTLIIICVRGIAGPACKTAQPTHPPKKTKLFSVYDRIKPNVIFWTNVFTQYARGRIRPMIGIKPSKIWFKIFMRIQGVIMGAY